MNDTNVKKIAKILKKLIAEEWLAGNMYRFFVTAVREEDRDRIRELFLHTAEDEMNEHMKDMIDWALENGFDVPNSISECEKYADERLVKLTHSVRSGQDAEFYINKAILSEELAIEGYAKVINSGILQESYQLESIIVRNYYDEIEHHDQLGILGIADNITVEV